LKEIILNTHFIPIPSAKADGNEDSHSIYVADKAHIHDL